MELPKRKPIRLKEYDYTQNGAYFITICTKDRAHILSEIAGVNALDRPKIKLSRFGVVAEKYIKTIPGIDKYVIMPNHIHMIIKTENGTMGASSRTQSISSIIKSFKILVAKEIGKTIFQRSFYDHVIRGEQDYREIWEYIDGNPLKWREDELYN